MGARSNARAESGRAAPSRSGFQPRRSREEGEMNERILVVEDEPTIATGLRDDLELEGFDVEVAEDGTAALSRILEGKLDLILLDLMLPGVDGLEVCRQARLKGVRTPVIMLTANGQEVDKGVGTELGADDYVTKPFSRRALLARIK